MSIFEKRLFQTVPFGDRLSQARTGLGLSQEALAEAIGTTSRSISRWEHNQAIPQQYYRERLCEALHTTPEALFGAKEDKQQRVSQTTPLWYVPYSRNPYFIGREAILSRIHEGLHAEHAHTLTQPQVICGLGGIGKTQTILEYVYRFRSEYQAVLWIGAETTETLMSGYLALAHLFQLSEKDNTDPSLLLSEVKRWFQSHTNWLLVFDNVENLELLHTVMPDISQGHILITTRSQIIGTVGLSINLPKMDLIEGALFLLRRAKLLHPEDPLDEVPAPLIAQAKTLVEILDGLPLALDQAGAYIEETSCGLSTYLEFYATRRSILLNNRGTISNHHPASVTTTLSLSFQQVERVSPAAADLLRLCSFLHAEAIPRELITQVGSTLSPALQSLSTDSGLLDAAIRELRRFSLLHREPEMRTFSIHRLLQAIIQDEMSEGHRKQWIEQIIQTILRIFPDYRDIFVYNTGIQPTCQRSLPHALVCATTIEELGIFSLEAGEMLYRLGEYLPLLGNYEQAISLMEQALHIVQKILGSEHETVALYLNELALFYTEIQQYERAKKYLWEAFDIRKKVKDPDHPEIAESLWSLASFALLQGEYAQAEHFAQHALVIREKAFGPNHYEVALTLNTLGTIYTRKGELTQAGIFFQRSLNIYENTLESDHYLFASSLRNLGYFYLSQNKYAQAALFYERALKIQERKFGKYHSFTASALSALANIYFSQKRYLEAEAFSRRSISIYEKLPKPNYFYTAYSLIDLGEIYFAQGLIDLARNSLKRALDILGESVSLDCIDYQAITHCLLLAGEHLADQGSISHAKRYYRRALTIGEQKLGLEHPLTKKCRDTLEITSVLPDSK